MYQHYATALQVANLHRVPLINMAQLYFSRGVQYKRLLGEVWCSLATSRAEGLDLPSALRHAPSLGDFTLMFELWSHPMQAALRCFPDICSTFPFCVAGKGSGMEKRPPPTAATWQGRRAVGQEPAGHSRAYLWSAFSSLQSEALCASACLCTLSLSPCALSYCLSHA